MKKASSWLWGLVLIALGVILGVNALGIVRINIFFPGWWTLFIIVPSAIALITEKHKGGPLIGLLIGVAFLLGSLNVVSFGILWKLLLPAILVVIGLAILMKGGENAEVSEKIEKAKKAQREKIVEAEVVEEKKKKSDDEDDDDDDDDDKDEGEWTKEECWSTFSDQDVNYDGKKFTGCKVDAVFGGADVDLRKAKIENEAILKASSIFGGIIVYVPDDVKVEVASTSIFGGVSDKRKSTPKSEEVKKTLYIEATCIFGGVEIR